MSMIPRQLLRIFQLTCLRQKFGHFEKSILFTFIRPKHLNLNTDFSKKNVLQTLLVNAKLQSVPLSLLQLKILKKIGALCIQQQSGGLHFKKNRSLFYFETTSERLKPLAAPSLLSLNYRLSENYLLLISKFKIMAHFPNLVYQT